MYICMYVCMCVCMYLIQIYFFYAQTEKFFKSPAWLTYMSLLLKMLKITKCPHFLS